MFYTRSSPLSMSCCVLVSPAASLLSCSASGPASLCLSLAAVTVAAVPMVAPITAGFTTSRCRDKLGLFFSCSSFHSYKDHVPRATCASPCWWSSWRSRISGCWGWWWPWAGGRRPRWWRTPGTVQYSTVQYSAKYYGYSTPGTPATRARGTAAGTQRRARSPAARRLYTNWQFLLNIWINIECAFKPVKSRYYIFVRCAPLSMN